MAEQGGVRHTARIEGGEDHACLLMEAAVEFGDGDHVAEFAVLVGLARLEGFAVGHGDGRPEALGKPIQIAQVRRCGNGDLAAQLLGIGGHRAQDHQPFLHATAAFAAAVPRQLVQQQPDEQEMAQVVGGHAQFVTLR